MPFKLSYSFEGNFRSKPEQNLAGASRKQSREVLIQRAHEERLKRQEQRLRLKSTEILQSHVRSYLIRKQKKQEERWLFDQIETTASLHELLRKLLFAYDPKVDVERLIRICEKLLAQREFVLHQAEVDGAFCWLLRRLLVRAMESLFNPSVTSTVLHCLDTFTVNSQIMEYLISKGYFKYLNDYFKNVSENDPVMDCLLVLIYRPFELRNISPEGKKAILSEFNTNFLGSVTSPSKNILIPYLRNKHDFPYGDVIQHLSESTARIVAKDLLYSVLALEPDDFEPTKASLQVLASISVNIRDLNPVPNSSDDSDAEDDQPSSESMLLEDIVHLMNNTERVKKILHFYDRNSNNEEILMSFTQLCHNLLLVYKDSIRRFMLLYMLALKSVFLNNLWRFVKKNEANIRHTMGLTQWRDPHKAFSVFCDMFTFYTETLTDSESTDTSGTFNSRELQSMSELFKTMSVYLIEYAFPMCRSNMIIVAPEILHFYYSCLHAVKMLYMLDLRKKFCSPTFWTSTRVPVSHDLPRKNYLSKVIKPFVGVVMDDEDEHLPPLSTIEQRSLAVMQQLPFFIDFNTRVQLLRLWCKSAIYSDANSLAREFNIHEGVVIRRTHLYEDAFEKLSLEREANLRQKVRIQFINSAGLEEAGIDGGGIFKEFINEVLKTAFDPNRGFFLLTADNMLYPNPNVHLIVENYAQHYFFIGRLVGKAIFENILVDLPLAEFFLAKMLVDKASAHHLKSLDPILYRNLLYLRDYTGDVQDLGLDFTSANNDLGETRIIELKPNGRNIPVTNDNRLEYIHRLSDFKLNAQIKRQCDAFREGLDSVVPLIWLRLFNYYELQVIIGGDTQEMDLADLQEHTIYSGEFTPDHPTIVIFWQILEKFTDTQKKQLLKFVTSCSRPPLLGFKELNPSFCIQSSGNEDRMPTASTCLNLLKIPIITDEEVLRNKLLSAIAQGAGFELS